MSGLYPRFSIGQVLSGRVRFAQFSTSRSTTIRSQPVPGWLAADDKNQDVPENGSDYCGHEPLGHACARPTPVHGFRTLSRLGVPHDGSCRDARSSARRSVTMAVRIDSGSVATDDTASARWVGWSHGSVPLYKRHGRQPSKRERG